MLKAGLAPTLLMFLATLELIGFIDITDRQQRDLDTTKHQLAKVQSQLQTDDKTMKDTSQQLQDAQNQLQDTAKKLHDTQVQLQEEAQKVAQIQPLGTFHASWYTSYDAGVGFTTASGKPVQAGVTVAVDPAIIPLGSKLTVKFPDGSTQTLTAEDTGGAIHGNTLDIYCSTRSEAFSRGMQDVQVYLIKG